MAPLNRKYKAGLAAFGLSLASASLAPGQQEAAPPIPATMPAQAPSDAPAFAVLVLSNGRILQGNVSQAESGDAYELHLKGGSIPVPKKDVVKRYRSIVAMYEDKAAHLAERDPDERMKLALWCLEQKNMEAQAREQLLAVLAINPGDRRAARMVANIDANAQRAAARDPEVRAAAAEVVATPLRERTGRDAAAPAEDGRRPDGRAPVIFDLPPDVASRRFVEFAWDVHPILQASCGSCHNESYQGDFRLIGRTRREWTADVVRANLDATLRYVRRDDPAHSDLVAYAANPHGPSPRPVFSGANDRRYHRLVAWLGLLKPADEAAKAGSAPQALMSNPAPAGEGFGADRLRGASTNPTPMPVLPMPSPSPSGGIPVQSYPEPFPTQAVAPGVPPDVKFDAPSFPGSLKAPLPPLPGPTTAPTPSNPAAKAPAPSSAAGLSNLPPGTPVPPPDDVIPPTNRPKKSNKVDPALLEKLMKSRQQGQP